MARIFQVSTISGIPKTMKFYEASEYQECNNRLFEVYRAKIISLLPTARIEHIGSSSVPGAISKGDLDIFVGVEPVELENAVLKLEEIGFFVKLDTLRTSELCMLESNEPDVALQVVANKSKYEFFITFRNALINSPELLSSYNSLKKNCIFFSEEDYRKVKSDFISRALKDNCTQS